MTTNKKSDTIKQLFTKANVKITEAQTNSFIDIFELMLKEKISSAEKPLKEEIDKYKRDNYELTAKLEQSNKTKSRVTEKVVKETIDTKKLEESITKQIKASIKPINEKKLKEDIVKDVTKSLKSLSESIKPTNLDLDPEIKKVKSLSNMIEGNMKNFAKVLTETESNEVQKLKDKLNENETKSTRVELELQKAKKKIEVKDAEISNLTENHTSYVQNTELTMLLENSNLSNEEVKFMDNIVKKLKFDEAKQEITKYIQMNESKNEMLYERTQRIEPSGIKSKNDPGMLKRPINEKRGRVDEMEEWAKIAGVEDAP